MSAAPREVVPLAWPADAALELPGSKSEANRLLVAAALSGRRVEVDCGLPSDDVRHVVDGLATLGYGARFLDARRGRVAVGPRSLPAPTAGELHCGNAGTALRFLVALAAVTPGEWTLTGDPRLLERPTGPLVAALRQLGADVRDAGGTPPVVVRGGLTRGGRVRIDASRSSQFTSALLLVGAHLAGGLEVEFDGPPASLGYARLTARLLERVGVRARVDGRGARVEPVDPDAPVPARLVAGSDWSAMGVWTALAHLTESRVVGLNLERDSGQDDEHLAELLDELAGPGPRTLDVARVPDQFMNLAVVAARRRGTTRLVGAANLRLKECDRLAVTARELRRLGVDVRELADGLEVEGTRRLRPAVVDPQDDHRVAMALALVGLLSPGVVVRSPECVAKSYPGFWDDLERVRARTACVCVFGQRGAGKSTFARALATAAGRALVDVDARFVAEHGPIAAFVASRGWPAFRSREAELVRAAVEDGAGTVVALGGGALEDPGTRALLAARTLGVLVDAPLAVLRERVGAGGDARPSVTGARPEDELAELERRRRPHFEALARVVVDGTGALDEQVRRALDALGAPCRWDGAAQEDRSPC